MACGRQRHALEEERIILPSFDSALRRAHIYCVLGTPVQLDHAWIICYGATFGPAELSEKVGTMSMGRRSSARPWRNFCDLLRSVNVVFIRCPLRERLTPL